MARDSGAVFSPRLKINLEKLACFLAPENMVTEDHVRYAFHHERTTH
jgi:hypothetical protein